MRYTKISLWIAGFIIILASIFVTVFKQQYEWMDTKPDCNYVVPEDYKLVKNAAGEYKFQSKYIGIMERENWTAAFGGNVFPTECLAKGWLKKHLAHNRFYDVPQVYGNHFYYDTIKVMGDSIGYYKRTNNGIWLSSAISGGPGYKEEITLADNLLVGIIVLLCIIIGIGVVRDWLLGDSKKPNVHPQVEQFGAMYPTPGKIEMHPTLELAKENAHPGRLGFFKVSIIDGKAVASTVSMLFLFLSSFSQIRPQIVEHVNGENLFSAAGSYLDSSVAYRLQVNVTNGSMYALNTKEMLVSGDTTYVFIPQVSFEYRGKNYLIVPSRTDIRDKQPIDTTPLLSSGFVIKTKTVQRFHSDTFYAKKVWFGFKDLETRMLKNVPVVRQFIVTETVREDGSPFVYWSDGSKEHIGDLVDGKKCDLHFFIDKDGVFHF